MWRRVIVELVRPVQHAHGMLKTSTAVVFVGAYRCSASSYWIFFISSGKILTWAEKGSASEGVGFVSAYTIILRIRKHPTQS